MSEKWKKIWRFIMRPSGWFLSLTYFVTSLCIAGALILVFVQPEGLIWEITAYVSYALAAITLAYTVYTIVLFAPRIKRKIIVTIRKIPVADRVMEDFGFKTVLFAAGSLFLNTAYAVFNAVLAVFSRSVWYGALAGYYMLLTCLRGGLVFYHRKKGEKTEEEKQAVQLRKYRNCGILLVLLPFFLSFAILEMVTNGSAFVRVGWTVYAVAAYTFYKISMAIVNFVRARHNEDLTVPALRNVGLADAMVSILALQTSLLYAFGNGAETGFVNALTGGAVCALTAALGVIMLVVAHKKKKDLRKGNGNG